jgi:hypothetical protein
MVESKVIDREAIRVAIMETGLRYLTQKAGGLIVVSKAEYLDSINDDYHFHMEKRGDELRFYSTPENECTMDEEEKAPSMPIFGPHGGRIQ